MSTQIDFEKDFENFDNDISHIDDRLDKINSNIVLLQSHIDRLTQLILTASSNQDKSKYYSAQSNMLKTLSLYNDNYQRLLELKFKYRSEQGEYKLKTRKFIEIELKRLEQTDEGSTISYNQVLQSLTKLASASTNLDNGDNNNSKLNFQFSDDEKI